MNTYILMVESSSGSLSRIAPDLEALDFQIRHAVDQKSALQVVQETPLLALVVIEDAIGQEDCISLVTAIKKSHPDLPILLKPCESASITRFGEFMPDAILSLDADSREIRHRAELLLSHRLYPDTVVEMIQRAAQAVLLEAFKSDISPGAPCLRANRNTLAPISAILAFCGPGISGRLVMSGSSPHLASIYRAVLPNAGDITLDMVEDVAGEVANQILGRIKEYFVRRGVDFELASPVFLRGTTVEVRYKAGRPSLVIPLEGKEGTLYLQFCVDTFDPRILSDGLFPDEDEDKAPKGSIVFL